MYTIRSERASILAPMLWEFVNYKSPNSRQNAAQHGYAAEISVWLDTWQRYPTCGYAISAAGRPMRQRSRDAQQDLQGTLQRPDRDD